jgi:hypothetical protein
VQSVSAVGHPGASGARSRGDHPEGVSWGYVQVVRARRRRGGTRPRRARRSSEVGERPGDRDMSVEGQGGARQGSEVREWYMQLSWCGNSRASGKLKGRRGKHGNNQTGVCFSQ